MLDRVLVLIDPPIDIFRYANNNQHSWNQQIIAAQIVIVLLFEGKPHRIGLPYRLGGAFELHLQPRRTNRSPAAAHCDPQVNAVVIDFRLVDSIPGDAHHCAHPVLMQESR